MTNFRQLIEKAASDLAIFRYPDVVEADRQLKLIFEQKEGCVVRGDLSYVTITDDNVFVQWRDTYESLVNFNFPVFILNSNDPILSARIYCLEWKIKELISDITRYKAAIETANIALQKAKTELLKLNDSKTSDNSDYL
jgi:hypothetical protein